MTAGPGRAVLGCESGYVGGWTDEAGLAPIGDAGNAVWAIAVRGDRVFAAGAHGHSLTSPADWTVASLRGTMNVAEGAAAIGPEGDVACGDISGGVLLCPLAGEWVSLGRPRGGSRVLALCFDEASALWAAWRDGSVTEAAAAADGRWHWRREFEPRRDRPVAAAFDQAGRRLALCFPGGEVDVVHLSDLRTRPAWAPRPGISYSDIRALAWSPGGLLALTGAEFLFVGEPGGEPEQLRGEGAGGHAAFLDDDHLVTAQGTDIVDWAIREAGSSVPDPYVQDTITAVAVDPREPSCSMVGTRRGRVVRYDSRGSATLRSAGLFTDRDQEQPTHHRIHQLVRLGDDWLIAAHNGAYRLAPSGNPVRLRPTPHDEGSYLCWTVAATARDGAFACDKEVRSVSGEPPLTFGAVVRDIRSGADGALAAIDGGGLIRVRDAAGGEWRPPARPPRDGVPHRAGWRLLEADGTSVTAWNPGGGRHVPEGEIERVSRYGERVLLGRLPAGAVTALRFDGRRFLVGCREQGAALVTADGEGPGPDIIGISARTDAIATDGRRIVVAAGKRVAGYDLLNPASTEERGVVVLRVAPAGRTCQITLPGGAVVELAPGEFAELRRTETDISEELRRVPDATAIPAGEVRQAAAAFLRKGADLAIRNQSALVAAAGRVGDDIWRNGLNLAMDQARADDPDRPVRLEWHCDEETDDIPWELVHPSASPLGWFDDPAVTSVRSVTPRAGGTGDGPQRASTPMTRHRMQVIRGTDFELATSNDAFLQTSRRTRLSNLTMLSPQPVVIDGWGDIETALRDRPDILQIWAHCGPEGARFSKDAFFWTDRLARYVAPRVSRLAIIVGCRSGALGRALVGRGVEAVVAMRVEVYSRTIQSLVTDLVSLALDGMPIDRAFAEALRGYVLTGQPGAAAVPMLYLTAGSSGKLFG